MPTPFADSVYQALRLVPSGNVTTYKNLALKLNTRAYQAIGTALKNNPYAPEFPCHRVVRSDGTIGGFMGATSGPKIDKKIKLLESEGVQVNRGRILNFEQILV